MMGLKPWLETIFTKGLKPLQCISKQGRGGGGRSENLKFFEIFQNIAPMAMKCIGIGF